mgnify:CR=1 FL=1
MTIEVRHESPFKIELYRPDVMPVDALTAEVWTQEAEEYESLGFKALATRSRQHAARWFSAPVVGRRLATNELAVWTWRYPSAYCSRPPLQWRSDQATDLWQAMTWPVPAYVRTLIREAAPAYDRLEIWTPELRPFPRVGPSPILLGVRGTEWYLLARWAEALEPFEAIRARAQCWRGWLARRTLARATSGR